MKEEPVQTIIQKLEGSWDQANDWIAEVWMPQAIKAGFTASSFSHRISATLNHNSSRSK
jgi:hypothetical protein